MTVNTGNRGPRRLVRGGLMLLGVMIMATMAESCGGGGGGGGGGGPPCAAGAITVNWTVSDGTNAISCSQAGASDVALTVDGATADFPCASLSGTAAALPAGDHTVSAQLLDGASNVLDMVGPMTVSVGCGQSATAPTIPFVVAPPVCDPAKLQLAWTLSANGAPVSCAQAGASEVDVLIDTMEVPFPCADLGDTTPDFAAGPHSVSFELRDAAQNVLSQLPAMSLTFGCGQVDDIGSIEFSLTP